MSTNPVIVDTLRSPHARLRGVPLGAVRLADGFWEPRRRVNRSVTLPSQFRKLEETGRIDNFRRAAGKKGGEFQGRYYNDSDVYKWIEACAFTLAEGPDPELEAMLDGVIREIADAQQADGYLNTYFTRERQDQRWTDLRVLHELYCAGHLIQAAIAHFRCTGRTELLDVAGRYADYICEVFGPEGRVGTCGHPEAEMAFVELYRVTTDQRYLVQARRFMDARGQQPRLLGGDAYRQDHAPFTELDAVTGHAVRMVYLCCGAADLLAETGDAQYAETLERLWQSMVYRRMYVTGGIGSRWEGEAFGEDFELPNDRSYAESCAAIGSIMWNWRMLLVTGEARFADLIETTLYNAMLPSLSLDGEHYFYENLLADNGRHRRQPWFDCACCPPNIARMLASLPGYFYSTSADGVWVHQYASGTAELTLGHGSPFALTQEADYPWSGVIELRISEAPDGPVSLRLRIPSWCEAASVSVNGDQIAHTAEPNSYAELNRAWKPGDVVRLDFPMEIQRLRSHPHVLPNTCRIALRRGPLIYCVEQADLGSVDPRDIGLATDEELEAVWEPKLLSGVMTLQGEGLVRDLHHAWDRALYAPAQEEARLPLRGVRFKAIPYYAWANREAGGMAVWISTD